MAALRDPHFQLVSVRRIAESLERLAVQRCDGPRARPVEFGEQTVGAAEKPGCCGGLCVARSDACRDVQHAAQIPAAGAMSLRQRFARVGGRFFGAELNPGVVEIIDL